MENVDISEWVKSALIIDDKWGEVKGLIRTLNSSGVSTSYYNPNPKQDFLLEEFGVSVPEDLEETEKSLLVVKLEGFIRDSLADLSVPQLAPNSVTGHNLIFLDINFGFAAAAGNVKSQVNSAVQLFADALSDQSIPYGVVLWSKESSLPYDGDDGNGESTFEYIKKMLYEVALPEKPKPLFIIDLEKSIFWEHGDYTNLADALRKALNDDKMAKFFAYWNKEVLQSAALTCKDIQDYAIELIEESTPQGGTETIPKEAALAKEFFNILKYATYTHFGLPRQDTEDMPDILARYSLSYMSTQLCDKLHSHFSQKKISGFFDDHTDHIQARSVNRGLEVRDCHEAFCKLLEKNQEVLDEETHQTIANVVHSISLKYPERSVHKVLAKLNYNALFAPALADIKNLPGLIYSKEFKENARVYLNITPPCDIAQGRGPCLYLTGRTHIFTNYHGALDYYHSRIEGDRFFKTPPALFGQENYVVFSFDMKGILKKIDDPKAQANYLLKDSIFADLMQKFGHHNSRLGARTFN